MFFKNSKTYLFLIVSLLIIYVIHHFLLIFLKINQDGFYYSLERLYCVFFIMSFIIVSVLLKIKERSYDQVGMSFMLLTTVKMGFYYWLLRPILNKMNEDIRIEKMNFFILFLVFLTIETIVTIRILSKKP